jgi:tRNA A-37 threonylcarbamoyl transferase component Bud32
MPSYAQNKEHIYKWRMNNLDRKRELDKKHQKKRTIWKEIRMEFFSILLI